MQYIVISEWDFLYEKLNFPCEIYYDKKHHLYLKWGNFQIFVEK
jgi:hypothetical protein